MAGLHLGVAHRRFPLARTFAISRGTRKAADVVVVELRDGSGCVGRGECLPYARYGETIEGVMAVIRGLGAVLADGFDQQDLAGMLPAGAARNAVDCALWDLQAKQKGQPVWQLAGLQPPQPVLSAISLSVDTPEAMAEAAQAAQPAPLLKLKLTGEGDLTRVASVREASPQSRLIVDANEGWQTHHLAEFLPALAELGVEMVEQPLAADDDGALDQFDRAQLAGRIAICADESCHDTASLEHLVGRYDMINIKLDKTGGLTEALKLREAAQALGLDVMVGCMLASSLAMAPAILLAQGVAVADLDGPLWLSEDWQPSLRYRGGMVGPADPRLWG